MTSEQVTENNENLPKLSPFCTLGQTYLIKQLVKQYKSRNEVVVWFTQMMCYNVYLYVLLLLRLSKNVEENPGSTIYDIIAPSQTVCADFSQSDESRFGQNAGKQCVAMSPTSIIHNEIKGVNIWARSFLNTILFMEIVLNYSCILSI